MKAFDLVAPLALVAILAATPAGAAPLELKLGHVGEPGSLFAQSSEEFARLANERLGDSAKVVVFGSSQLGGDKEMLKKLKLGTLDLALPSTVMSSEVPEFGVFEMPYLVKDREHMQRIEKDVVWPKLVPLADEKGYRILAVWENGFRHVTNSRRPIVKPEDLQGIKLRTPQGVWRLKMFQAYGASPSPLAFSEVFVALQTGVMDGQENPFAQIYPAKFQEVQKYLSLTGHVYTPAYLTAGSRKWDGLPADVRGKLEQAAKEAQAYVYRTAARLDEELLDKLRQGGMEVNEVDKDAFIRASKSIYEEFSAEVPSGKALIETSLSLGKTS